MAAAVVVGIGEGAVVGDAAAELVTYALGSCVAVAAWDPVVRAGGLVHYMLPLSVLDEKRAQARPFMYCDSGLPLMLQQLYGMGARKERLIVCAAGGAQVLDKHGIFNIGHKNEQILRRLLAGYRLQLRDESLGGAVSRTVGLQLATGRFWIREYPLTLASDMYATATGTGAGA